MSLGLVGKKLGMTHVYTKDGSLIPCTVIHVGGCQVLQVKSSSGKDGYSAAQVGYDSTHDNRVSKPVLGHTKKHGGTAKRKIVEFRFKSDEGLPSAGAELGPDVFSEGQVIDVIGVTKGRGFQGVVKRWNFAGQPSTHGSMMHRRPGSIGCRLTPGLVWKNQKMPGHMGVDSRTVQNLKVVQVRKDDGLLLVSGSVAGAPGGYLVIRPAIKAKA
jgi:large subunit ribosomal protein L3